MTLPPSLHTGAEITTPGPQTVRALLAAAPPPVAMKQAWRAYLQAARAHRRRTGWTPMFGDRASIERCLDLAPRDPQAERLARTAKAVLVALVHHGLSDADQGDAVRKVDAILRRLAPQVETGGVRVVVGGWPGSVPTEVRSAVLGHAWAPELLLPAVEAAALRHAVHGQLLGGSTLRVDVALDEGRVLPAPPRAERDRSRRTRGRPWLPHHDEVGRHSLSPLSLAEAQAALVPTTAVVDAFCGVGGNSVAFARAGLSVVAVERDAARAALARANLRELDLPVDVVTGDAAVLLPTLPRPGRPCTLFLDPPWGGPGSGGRPTHWDALVPIPVALCAGFEAVLLKAPRAFDLASLPAGWRWTPTFHLSAAGADGRCVVKAISCLGTRA